MNAEDYHDPQGLEEQARADAIRAEAGEIRKRDLGCASCAALEEADMATCPRCKRQYREPEGEQGEHCCPRCGLGPGDFICPECGLDVDKCECEEAEDD